MVQLFLVTFRTSKKAFSFWLAIIMMGKDLPYSNFMDQFCVLFLSHHALLVLSFRAVSDSFSFGFLGA